MADTLFLQFTGLCGIVPNQAMNRARVLLVDASQPLAGGGHGAVPHEPHVPVLLCAQALLHSSNQRDPDLVFLAYGNKFAAFFLADQDISLGNTTGSSLSFVNTDPNSGNGCHTSGNWQDINWVANMAKVSPNPTVGQPGSEVVKDECFLAPAQTVDPAVAARIALTQGKLTTSRLAKDGSDEILQWEFKTTAGTFPLGQQALGEEIQASVPLASGKVEFTTELLRPTKLIIINNIFPNGPGQKKTIVFSTQGGKVEVGIRNVPWADLLGLRQPLAPNYRDADEHFEHFYSFSKTPQVKRVPHPLLGKPRCSASGPPSLGTPQCPPVLFGPHPNA